MKKIVFAAGLALLFATSCNKETINNEVINTPVTPDSATLVPVHVHVSDFSVAQEDFPETRTTTQTPEASGVKAMTLAFYHGDAEVYKTTQLKDDATTYTTFGDFQCALPKGSYTMVVLGYGYYDGDELALTSPTQAAYTTDHTRETFTATQTVNITSNESVEVSATLSRIVARLHLASSDVRTSDAVNIRMTLSAGGKAFNPTTGQATVNTGFSNTVTINKPVGEATGSATYIFLASDEQTMDVTIDVLDAAGNSITHRVIPNVPFKRNRSTKITGALYSAPVSTSFLLDTDWLPETEITF